MGKKSFTVHVPATTANLGPGFDCLGLALDLWNHVSFTIGDFPFSLNINGQGEGTLPENESNLIMRSAKRFALANERNLPAEFRIDCQNNIPIASGLGSSAGAAVCGIAGAAKLLDIDINMYNLLQLATEIEGHADNAAACIFGGLVVVRNQNGIIKHSQYAIQPITAAVAIPDYSMSTKKAREVLPEQILLKDAVMNIAHSIELVQSLIQGDFDRLRENMVDNLHQKYRLPLLPGAAESIQSALKAEAYGACISGAGPGIVAFTSREKSKSVGEAMQSAYQEKGISSQIFILEMPAKGMVIT
jgi:homoserine kinase